MVSTIKTDVQSQLKHFNYQPEYALQILRNLQLSQHYISQEDIKQLSEAIGLASTGGFIHSHTVVFSGYSQFDEE